MSPILGRMLTFLCVALLLAAGYAPAWGERDLTAPGLAVVNRALDYMLAQHEPFPAFVVDRRWNLLRANRGAATPCCMDRPVGVGSWAV